MMGRESTKLPTNCALQRHIGVRTARAAQKSHIYAALKNCFYHLIKNQARVSVNTLFTLLFQGKLALLSQTVRTGVCVSVRTPPCKPFKKVRFHL